MVNLQSIVADSFEECIGLQLNQEQRADSSLGFIASDEFDDEGDVIWRLAL
jgi:hypothetical protein